MNSVITIKSNEVPDIPHLKPIDVEQLLKKVISQLYSDKYHFVAQKTGNLEPLEVHKTPLNHSEIVLHICLREDNLDFNNNGNINKKTAELIAANKLKIVRAVRHAFGKYMRIVANIDSEIP